ncbi:MAG: YraN family protein [Pseudomonadales bacterium]|nr:YraN family protein [Pseudomonadales bacterium]
MFTIANSRAWRGIKAERQAARYLQQQGLRLQQRNYRCRFGEIDLIMIDPGRHLVFVEVRYRSASDYATALQSIDRRKQDRIRKTAASFLAAHSHYQQLPARFDVLAIQTGPLQQAEKIDWIQDAFQ